MFGLDEFGLLKFLVKWFSAIKLLLQKKFSIGLDYLTRNKRNITEEITLIPKSVNYHFTRRCNYECGFCFHTAKTSFVLPIEEAKKGLLMLKEAGMEKINFSGGEPLIEDRGRYLGELARYCKVDLRLPSVSIVTNASLLYKSWFTNYGKFIDILAVSCDSFDEQTNITIGRGKGKHLVQLEKAASWCRAHDILFKINTVVCSANVHEDMSENISLLNPCRWKVFQCLVLEGENAGPEALRNAEKLQISDEEFQAFVTRHQHLPCIVPESNQKMKDSYLILDEYMRFLNCQEGKKEPSPSILDVGVDKALSKAGFDEEMFRKRGGIYKWSKPQSPLDW